MHWLGLYKGGIASKKKKNNHIFCNMWRTLPLPSWSGIAGGGDPIGGKYEHGEGRIEHNTEIDCKGNDINLLNSQDEEKIFSKKSKKFSKGRQEIDIGRARNQEQANEYAHNTG